MPKRKPTRSKARRSGARGRPCGPKDDNLEGVRAELQWWIQDAESLAEDQHVTYDQACEWGRALSRWVVESLTDPFHHEVIALVGRLNGAEPPAMIGTPAAGVARLIGYRDLVARWARGLRRFHIRPLPPPVPSKDAPLPAALAALVARRRRIGAMPAANVGGGGESGEAGGSLPSSYAGARARGKAMGGGQTSPASPGSPETLPREYPSPGLLRLWRWLFEQRNRKQSPTQEDMALSLSMGSKTVRKHLVALRERKAVECDSRGRVRLVYQPPA